MINLKRLQLPVGGGLLGKAPSCDGKLIQWLKAPAVDGVLIDKVGKSGSEVGREYIGGAYLDGDGLRELRIADYPSTAFTYVDHTTKIVENGATDTNGDWLVPTNGVDLLTIDGYLANFETGNQDTQVGFTNQTTGDRFYGEIQNATGSDRVDTDTVYGYMDNEGYTVSDGASYYYDDALTQLVPSDKRSLTVNGKSGWYTADSTPEYAPADFSGLLKANKRVIDGVVDLVTANVLDNTNTSHVVAKSEITVYSTTGTFRESYVDIVSDNSIKTVVSKAENIQGSANPRLVIQPLGGGSALTFVEFIDDGEYRALFTPNNGGYRLIFTSSRSVSEVGEKRYYDFAVYEGDYVTGNSPLPTSGQPVIGNSLIQSTKRLDLVTADALTTVRDYDNSDPDNVVALVVPVEDYLAKMVDNPQFTSPDDLETITGIREQLLYSEVIDEPCYTKVLKYLKLVEGLVDSNGEPLFDSNNDRLYALKEGVTD